MSVSKFVSNLKPFIVEKLAILFVFCTLLSFINFAGAQPIAASVHRVLFLGNSITYAGYYVNDIEAYYICHYPKQEIEFINVGLPSETVSGLSEPGHASGKFPRPDLHERLERVLTQTKPDLVFACYGMNDGIYLPFDTGRFQAFKDGVQWLHVIVAKSGARIIHLTPPVYDELRGKHFGYAAVLDKYADWLLGMRKTASWEVADLHYPMKNYLDAHRKVDAEFGIDGFYLAQDGVHPGEVGHWIMARSILNYLGEKGLEKVPDILTALKPKSAGEQIYRVVSQRQSIMKDAWLTSTGHKRPGMKVGLPIDGAILKTTDLTNELTILRN